MPRYTSTETAFIYNRLVAAGEPFDYNETPGPHMQPAKDERGREDKDARKAKDEAVKTDRPAPGHPKYLGDLIDYNVAGGGETKGRVDGSMGQQTVLGVRVDETGQVRGVTEDVGTGDPADGSRRDDKGEGPGHANGE